MQGHDIRDGDESPPAESGSELPRLTRAEDAELRQLAWFAKAGQLSDKSQARLSELRARDRRDTIRDPRPDPTSGINRSAIGFGPPPSAPPVCPNCGFGLQRLAGQPGSCPGCGFLVRGDGPESPGDADPSASSQAELPPLGSIDGETFRALLLSAAMGGPPGESSPTPAA